jgi:hypothetical protein
VTIHKISSGDSDAISAAAVDLPSALVGTPRDGVLIPKLEFRSSNSETNQNNPRGKSKTLALRAHRYERVITLDHSYFPSSVIVSDFELRYSDFRDI